MKMNLKPMALEEACEDAEKQKMEGERGANKETQRRDGASAKE
jgi:hypothetical protein